MDKWSATYLHVTLGNINRGHSGMGGTTSQNTTKQAFGVVRGVIEHWAKVPFESREIAMGIDEEVRVREHAKFVDTAQFNHITKIYTLTTSGDLSATDGIDCLFQLPFYTLTDFLTLKNTVFVMNSAGGADKCCSVY